MIAVTHGAPSLLGDGESMRGFEQGATLRSHLETNSCQPCKEQAEKKKKQWEVAMDLVQFERHGVRNCGIPGLLYFSRIQVNIQGHDSTGSIHPASLTNPRPAFVVDELNS